MSLILNADTALANAEASWVGIAPRLRVNATAYTLSVVRTRLTGKAKRIVVRLDAPEQPSFILKMNLEGVDQNHFENSVTAHRRAAEIFAGHKDLCVPKLIHVDEREQLILLEHVPGYNAHDALSLATSPSDRAYILGACGRWLGHLHQSTFVRKNKINPNAMKKFVEAQKDRVDAGTLKVPNPSLFVACAIETLKVAESARGKETALAATHGDMNLQNIILGPNGTFGIDFGAVHNAPIGHDLARFFVNFANYHFPDAASANDPSWLAVDHNSFFEGYGLEYQDDPSFHYLMRTQVLKEWTSIPKDAESRNTLHKRRWKGTKLLVDLLF